MFGPIVVQASRRLRSGDEGRPRQDAIPDAIGSALMAFVLIHAVHYAGAQNWVQGAAVGFFNRLGFVAVATLGSVTFEKRSLQLYLINNAYLLLALLLMGAVLAVRP